MGAAQLFNLASLQPYDRPDLAKKIQVLLAPNLVMPLGTVLSELASTPGTFRPYGQNTTLTAAASAGALTISVASAQGFYVGEAITLGPNGSSQSETATVTAIAGTVLTVGAGLTYAYVATNAVKHGDSWATLAKTLLAYDVSTDSAGVITYTGLLSGLGQPMAQATQGVGAYYTGSFRATDLTGMDAPALTNMAGALVQGTLINGVVRI